VAVVLIGGLLTSTLLTLVFVPAMYTVFDDVERGLRRLLGWRTAPLAPSPSGRALLAGVEAASERPEPRPRPAAPASG
jgi:HAE1 family hydrophobic/amphiphilic exporter-1